MEQWRPGCRPDHRAAGLFSRMDEGKGCPAPRGSLTTCLAPSPWCHLAAAITSRGVETEKLSTQGAWRMPACKCYVVLASIVVTTTAIIINSLLALVLPQLVN